MDIKHLQLITLTNNHKSNKTQKVSTKIKKNKKTKKKFSVLSACMPGLLDAAPVTVEGKQTLKDNRYGVDTLNDGEEATF